MSDETHSTGVRIARGLVAGAIAGAVASFAMDRFQALATALLPSDDSASEDEPATEKAADLVAVAATGHEVPYVAKPLAGQSVHYALGIGLGIAYGIAAEFGPSATTGFGTAFGFATATLLDETVVPAAGLGKAPWNASSAETLYGYASHLVFGVTAEIVRRQVASTLIQQKDSTS